MIEKITVTFLGSGNSTPQAIAVRCPHCRKEVVAQALRQDLEIGSNFYSGERRCPDIECQGLIFVIYNKADGFVATYPPTRIDFNPENIPQNIMNTFEQAITCHSTSCFVASAIMVRRTLEEVCADQGAEGNNLKERIEDLESKVTISRNLLNGMNELRLMGNDAAHVEATDYENISEKEAALAIECAKEILKSLYQQEAIVKKLKSLKKA